MRATESAHSNLSRPPKLHGRYLVCRLLGKGAQARVYLAYDTRLRQWRAVKVLAPTFLEDDLVRARFEQEARAMARLSHPSLLRVVDIDQDGRTPFMVMELARGGSVTDWIKRHGPIPPVLACRVAQRACDGLAHAHMTGVIHRDVKPHNLLIREDGSVALTDFGIARVEEDEHQLTATGTIMGTFAFMAPEQRSDAKSVDLRADVYSLGATLYTMLTGRTSPELFFAESRDTLLEGVPEALRSVILSACRYERDQRFANMADFHAAIERKISKLPKDPGTPHLATALMPIPDVPPQWLDADSGVEELSRALLAELEEMPTVVPGGSRDKYSSTPYPSTLPYRMPIQRTVSMQSASMQSGVHPSANSTWAGGLDAPGKNTGTLPDSSALGPGRSASSTWSEPFIDAHIDPGTVDAPIPHPPPPSKRKVDPVVPKAAQPDVSGSSLGGLFRKRISLTLIVGMSALLCAFVLIVGMGGLAAKAYTSHQLASASRSLVLITNEEASVVSNLVAAGANEAKLQERWTQFQEATSAHQPAAASALVEAIELEAERVGLSGLAESHIHRLARARREWEQAAHSREWVSGTLPAQMTGTLGSW